VTEQPGVDEVEEIRLTVPAVASFAHVARLAITGLAARLRYSYDDIEDLRIAVGEVVGALVGGGDGARLTLRCSVTDGAVHLDATRTPAHPEPVITDLTREILRAVVDRVEIDAAQANIRVIKRPNG
jgi:hypothetical protein